ncbi:MAG: hypothetical protein JHC93_04010 [Parachlamydiales bacterium]|nr:hypothetical protein [Parachlamydiales bacterium]
MFSPKCERSTNHSYLANNYKNHTKESDNKISDLYDRMRFQDCFSFFKLVKPYQSVIYQGFGAFVTPSLPSKFKTLPVFLFYKNVKGENDINFLGSISVKREADLSDFSKDFVHCNISKPKLGLIIKDWKKSNVEVSSSPLKFNEFVVLGTTDEYICECAFNSLLINILKDTPSIERLRKIQII